MAQPDKHNGLLFLATVPLAAVVGAFIVASVVSLFIVYANVIDRHSTALAGQAADALQFQLNQRELLLLKQIQTAATSSLLTELISGSDGTRLSLEEMRFRQLIPYAIRVRLFPLGSAGIDRHANPPFSFTSLDMVNRVESGQSVYPEAINVDGRWVLSMAAPVRSPADDTVRGTLFVYLEMSALSSGLAGRLNGEMRLVQTFRNLSSNDVLRLGSSAIGAPEVSRPLDNPAWKLRFYPSAIITNPDISSPLEFLMPDIVFLLIALAGVALSVFEIVSRANANAARARQMANVIAGQRKRADKTDPRSSTDRGARLVKRHDEPPDAKGRDDRGARQVKRRDKPPDATGPDDRPPDGELIDIEWTDENDGQASTDTALAGIFRAYDIRGIYNDTLTTFVARKIGLAIGTEAEFQGQQSLLVAADGRTSSPAVTAALIEGLTRAGRDVIDLGAVPTPLLYFATHETGTRSGVMVTASHNPPEYNGFKIVFDRTTLVDHDIQQIYTRFKSGDFSSGEGTVSKVDIIDAYMNAVTDDVVVAQPLKVVVDCGNGIAGKIAPGLLGNLGCEVVPLYCEVDGRFPNHDPDPLVPANLQELIGKVKSERADLGIAFDGDGDRLVAVTASGEIVWPDRLLMLFAKDVVSRNPGANVVYDVKCSRHLNSVISSFGGKPVMCRTGHSFVKAKVRETGAVLGGEMSGHICFGERWFGFDDALYAAARLLEIVGSQSEDLEVLLDEFPVSIATPEIQIPVADADKFRIVEQLVENADFADGTITSIDGLRVDFAAGWGLVRASNTKPCLTLRFEADDQASLTVIEERFKQYLKAVDKTLVF